MYPRSHLSILAFHLLLFLGDSARGDESLLFHESFDTKLAGLESVVGEIGFFKGAIDEVRIYRRVLDDEEIHALCPTAPRPKSDPLMLEGIWNQRAAKTSVTDGLLLNASDDQLNAGTVEMPREAIDVVENEGISVDFWFNALGQWKADEVLLDSRNSEGAGVHAVTTSNLAVAITLSDGQTSITWDTDPGLMTPGSYHVVATLDANPRIGTMVVNGRLCDGGVARPFGWKRLGEVPGNVRGGNLLRVSQQMNSVKIYGRHLRTSEAVSNFNSEKTFRIQTVDVTAVAASNPTFPVYHYMAPYGPWSGDVNGPLFHDDWFHVFYQWGTPSDGKICWGHARSRDLVDWLQFNPETSGILGYNEATYATQGLYHPDGRVVYWNTLHQWRRANKPLDWRGCLSLPRELSIGDDKTLRVKPLAELSRLRGEHYHAENILLADATKVLQGIAGDALEIRATIEPKDATSFGIVVRRSDDGMRGMDLRYRDTIYVDGEAAMYSLKHGKEDDPVRKPFVLTDGEPLKLALFIDKACIEAFINDRIIHACDHTGKALALPQLDDVGIALFAEDGEVLIRSIDVWQMGPIRKTFYEP